MKNSELKKFLNDEFWDLNKETVENLLDKELEKEPEEINTDFIDACMNYLTEYSNDKAYEQKGKVIKNKHSKRIVFRKLIIAAVIILLSISVGMTAYAEVNNMQISDIFVSIFANKAVIKYTDKELLEKYSNHLNGNPLYNELESNGVENIMLPFDLYNMDYNITMNDFSHNARTLIIGFENSIEVKLKDYKKKSDIRDLEINGTFIATKQININDIDIYLFERQCENGSETLITYQIEKTQYLIVIKEDITLAERFVAKNRL